MQTHITCSHCAELRQANAIILYFSIKRGASKSPLRSSGQHRSTIHCPLIPIITVRLPAINTLYRYLLLGTLNNLHPTIMPSTPSGYSTDFRTYLHRHTIHNTSGTFSNQMPGSLPNKRIHLYRTSTSQRSFSPSLFCSTLCHPMLSLIRVKITNWFRSRLCMNQASCVRDAPFEFYASSLSLSFLPLHRYR